MKESARVKVRQLDYQETEIKGRREKYTRYMQFIKQFLKIN